MNIRFFHHGRVKIGDIVTILVHAKRINFHSTKGWTSYVQKPLLSQNTNNCLKPRPKNMDEVNVLGLRKKGPKQTAK